MEGFLSLSLDKDIAVKFAINVDKEKEMLEKKKLIRTFIEVEVKE